MMNSAEVFSIFTIGFNACFSLYLLFRFFNSRSRRYFYLFLSLLGISFIINSLLRLGLIHFDLEYKWIIKLRIATVHMMTFLFYLFMYSFLDLQKKKTLRNLILIASSFVLLKILINFFTEISWVDSIHKIFEVLFRFVDLGMLFTFLFYLAKSKQTSHRLVLYGIVSIIICVLVMYYGHPIFHVYDFIKKESIRNIEVIMGFSFFFLAVLKRDNEIEEQYKQLKVQLLQKELEKQKSIECERERISHDMHDDLGAGISAIKLQTEFLLKKIQDKDLQQELSGLLRTSEDMNVSMREMLWSLNYKNDSVGHLIGFVTKYAEQFFEKSDTRVIISKKNIVPEKLLGAQRRRSLFLCSKEAFNNIYKHSFAENISIHFSQTSTHLHLQIADDGIGISKNSEKGNGLKNMKSRVEKLNGEFIISSSQEGTSLQFIIPFASNITQKGN